MITMMMTSAIAARPHSVDFDASSSVLLLSLYSGSHHRRATENSRFVRGNFPVWRKISDNFRHRCVA